MIAADNAIRDLLPKTVDKYTNYWIHISYNGLLDAFTEIVRQKAPDFNRGMNG